MKKIILAYRYLLIIIILAIVCVTLGLVIWGYNITKLQENHQKEVSDIIHNTVQYEAKKNILLPEIVFINVDSSQKKQLSDKILNQITQTLIKKYSSSDTTKFKDIDIHPFLIWPSKTNKNGNYELTESQLNDLKNHLDFLTKQVDIEIDKAKEEVARDIDRLNLWVTIWIGVIGFLGIFVPIIINVDTAKSAEKASEKSELAEKKSDDALTKISNAQAQIDKISGIEQKISEAEVKLASIGTKSESVEGKVSTAVNKAEEAEKKATEAYETSEKTERLLTAVNAISNLKNIDSGLLPHINEPKKFLGSTLEKVHVGLNNCNSHFNDEIVKDCLQQLGVYIHLLSFFKFIDHANTQKINEFVTLISNTLSKEYNEQNFNKILVDLKTLSDTLKAN